MFLYEASDLLLQPLADTLGFPVDRVKYIVCILLGYPLGYALRCAPLPPVAPPPPSGPRLLDGDPVSFTSYFNFS